jgi:hypothetical protein
LPPPGEIRADDAVAVGHEKSGKWFEILGISDIIVQAKDRGANLGGLIDRDRHRDELQAHPDEQVVT